MDIKQHRAVIELPQTESRIGAQTAYSGVLSFKSSLSVFGKVDGKIEGGELLVIHPQAEVDAQIEADYILLAGTVKGQILARKGVCFYATAVFQGSVISRTIRMYAGADFQGSCNFMEREHVDIFSLSRGEFRAMLSEAIPAQLAP